MFELDGLCRLDKSYSNVPSEMSTACQANILECITKHRLPLKSHIPSHHAELPCSSTNWLLCAMWTCNRTHEFVANSCDSTEYIEGLTP